MLDYEGLLEDTECPRCGSRTRWWFRLGMSRVWV